MGSFTCDPRKKLYPDGGKCDRSTYKLYFELNGS